MLNVKIKEMNILLEKLRHRLLNNEFIKFYKILAAILDFSHHIELKNWI